VLAVTAFVLIGSAPETRSEGLTDQVTIGMAIGMILWPAGFLHAFWVNATVRLRLRDQKDANPR
jgi:hypothetical protein